MKMLDKMDKIEDVESGTPDINIRFVIDRQPGKVISHLQIKRKRTVTLRFLKTQRSKSTVEIKSRSLAPMVGVNPPC